MTPSPATPMPPPLPPTPSRPAQGNASLPSVSDIISSPIRSSDVFSKIPHECLHSAVLLFIRFSGQRLPTLTRNHSRRLRPPSPLSHRLPLPDPPPPSVGSGFVPFAFDNLGAYSPRTASILDDHTKRVALQSGSKPDAILNQIHQKPSSVIWYNGRSCFRSYPSGP